MFWYNFDIIEDVSRLDNVLNTTGTDRHIFIDVWGI